MIFFIRIKKNAARIHNNRVESLSMRNIRALRPEELRIPDFSGIGFSSMFTLRKAPLNIGLAQPFQL